MRLKTVGAGSLSAASAFVIAVAAGWVSPSAIVRAEQEWQIHDRSRPQPRVIAPGEASTQERASQPPSDAIILFDGKDLSEWLADDGGPAKWKVENGYFEVVPKTGNIRTKRPFGDCQLHLEWAAPDPPHGKSQDRGNSGVFLMSLYEIQVLDSYHNTTYPDGQAAGVYGQYPPLVNACRPPGQWQTYDIIFHGPRFDKEGKVLQPAIVTVLQNGVLVQDQVAIMGPTVHRKRPPYHVTPAQSPLLLQDHSHPVRFRNIWIRELGAAGS